MGSARAQTSRESAAWRYPSDLDDREWAVIGPLLTAGPPGSPGRPPVHLRRVIAEAILYVNRTGCAWRYLPSEYPPWRTVYGYFAAWRADGTLDRVHDALRDQVRAAAGRSPAPSAAIID
jgi:transposase